MWAWLSYCLSSKAIVFCEIFVLFCFFCRWVQLKWLMLEDWVYVSIHLELIFAHLHSSNLNNNAAIWFCMVQYTSFLHSAYWQYTTFNINSDDINFLYCFRLYKFLCWFQYLMIISLNDHTSPTPFISRYSKLVTYFAEKNSKGLHK